MGNGSHPLLQPLHLIGIEVKHAQSLFGGSLTDDTCALFLQIRIACYRLALEHQGTDAPFLLCHHTSLTAVPLNALIAGGQAFQVALVDGRCQKDAGTHLSHSETVAGREFIPIVYLHVSATG